MPRKRSPRSSAGPSCSAGRVPLAPRPLVQPLGERLREPVGERLDDDRAVVVVRGDVRGRELVGARRRVTAKAPERGRRAGAT